MLFNLPTIFLAFTLALCATFKKEQLVMTSGLQSATFNNRLAVILDEPSEDAQGQERYPVKVFMGYDQAKRATPSLMFKDVRIKTENLEAWTGYGRPSVTSGSLPSGYKPYIGDIIKRQDSPEEFLKQVQLFAEIRLLGAAAHEQDGFDALVSIIDDELPRRYCRTIERVFDGIGRFMY